MLNSLGPDCNYIWIYAVTDSFYYFDTQLINAMVNADNFTLKDHVN